MCDDAEKPCAPDECACPAPESPPSTDYEWQTKVVDKWIQNGRRGVLQAVPGAGKTRAGIKIVQSVIAANAPERPKIAIIAPTVQIMQQWAAAFKEIGWEEDDYLYIRTYFWAAKLATQPHDPFDLVIFDECHSLMSEVRGKAFDIQKKAYCGMSATPLDSWRLLGGVFLRVDWDEANVAPFKIKYVKFQLTPPQQGTYRCLTNEVKNAYAAHEAGHLRQDELMMIIMKRRNFVYNLGERVNIVLQLVKEHPKDRIIIFAERLEQVRRIATALFGIGVPTAVYTSAEDTINLYQDKEVRVLVSSKMVKEGFNSPETTMGILASTPLTERNQVQTVGRIIRFFPEKTAQIFIVLADGTTDEKLIKNGMKGEVISVWPGGCIDPSWEYFSKLLGVEKC